MKIKKVKIGIRSLEDVLYNAREVMKKLERGAKVKKESGIYFENLAAFRRVITEKRLEMLHVIKERHPSSVYELAKMLDRDIKNVNMDLEYLKEVGLVEIKRSKEKRERVIPEVNYDAIELLVAV
ncbi:MAG TPA: hypothetical protein DDX84_09740 [Nitrospiraceae bacterium]|nr:hypothetical protein [Nitrospiraceae bacterium]